MYSASEARTATQSQAELRFRRALDTNYEIIRTVVAGGGREAVLYDGDDRRRMKLAIKGAGYEVLDPKTGCLRARW